MCTPGSRLVAAPRNGSPTLGQPSPPPTSSAQPGPHTLTHARSHRPASHTLADPPSLPPMFGLMIVIGNAIEYIRPVPCQGSPPSQRPPPPNPAEPRHSPRVGCTRGSTADASSVHTTLRTGARWPHLATPNCPRYDETNARRLRLSTAIRESTSVTEPVDADEQIPADVRRLFETSMSRPRRRPSGSLQPSQHPKHDTVLVSTSRHPLPNPGTEPARRFQALPPANGPLAKMRGRWRMVRIPPSPSASPSLSLSGALRTLSLTAVCPMAPLPGACGCLHAGDSAGHVAAS
jgi:hypothetical protein